jgi:hypothetical protein
VQVSENAYLNRFMSSQAQSNRADLRPPSGKSGSENSGPSIYKYVMRQIREFTPKEEAHHAQLIRREKTE